ncbi:hypothetical protein PtB15_7B372 [Puccinia triticina]|nr:hypothetical protein PtB15_7B372 [Puccinia triticina]
MNARVHIISENLKHLTLSTIPTRFFALENRATALLSHLESGGTVPVRLLGQNDAPCVVPFQVSKDMLVDPTYRHLNRLTVEEGISKLLSNITDLQEDIETLASKTLPEHSDESGLATSANTINQVPCAQSLVFFSQELNLTVFNAATSAIFKYSDVLGGLSPHEMELILSAPSNGTGTYEDKLAKLTTMENELIAEVILTMDPTQLITDSKEFEGQVKRLFQSHRPYRDLRSDVTNLRAERLRSQAIFNIISKNKHQDGQLAAAHGADNSHSTLSTHATAEARISNPSSSSNVPDQLLASVDPLLKRSATCDKGDANKRTKF